MAAEQACSLISTWIEPKYIIPAVVALISSGLFPFLLHKYKVKRDREEKLFDTRKTEYQGYFKTIEEAARLAGQDYDKYLNETLPAATLSLYQSRSSPESMVEYQSTLQALTKGINEGFQKATNELVSLRIVCSDNLAEQLDQFEGLYQQIMNLQSEMLQEIRESMTTESFITGEFNFETPSKIKVAALGSKLAKVRSGIIKTMRHEIGYRS